MDFKLCAEDIEFRRLRVDHDNAFNIYALAEFTLRKSVHGLHTFC